MSTNHCEQCNPARDSASGGAGQYVQSIDRYKWLEPKHMTNVRNRWAFDKTDTLQFVFFNAVGQP